MNTFQERLVFAFRRENERRLIAGEPRLTKTDLWKAAEASSAAATHWFSGANGADLSTCVKLSPQLRCNARWLFDGSQKIDEELTMNPVGSLDILSLPIFPLVCPECGKVSHKSFIELEMNDRLPCGCCGVVFNINHQYGSGQLKMFLDGIGRAGFVLRQNRKFD